MARPSCRALINYTGFFRREFSSYTHKFSLAKLSRNSTPSESASSPSIGTTAAVAADGREISSSSAPASGQPPANVWWGPDTATGMWAPSSSGSEVRFNDAVTTTAYQAEQAWFREDVHA
ncbi:hypothetical protein GOP47_0023758 [Adiantum capillus-veneris]|nr:hypothetical protein GOP47_0023758 [Adiantum capillus-veneris]